MAGYTEGLEGGNVPRFAATVPYLTKTEKIVYSSISISFKYVSLSAPPPLIYIYINIYIYIYTYTYIHIYIHIYVYISKTCPASPPP